jgi:4-diphosphocytidyl-2-C-methyl-D-erythritol kinase
MIVFPHCKINLGLNIVSKRPDNYHNLETVFYPLPFRDVLEVVVSDTDACYLYGSPIPGDPSGNLCVKAYQLIKKDFPGLPPVALHLYKYIPIGSGLGGGSSDGACMLNLLNTKFALSLSHAQLMDYALQLGSDCPFFLTDGPCLASGRGENLSPVSTDLSGCSLALVLPDIHVDTRDAFSRITPRKPSKPIAEIISGPIDYWKEELVNDFERLVIEQYPALAGIKEKLYDAGALYASMTGSGSCFYGIFRKNQVPSISFEQDFLVIHIN